jgi:hypothetical protein
MNHSHLSDDEMIALLYGLRDAEDHVAGCAECSERLQAMREAREATVDVPHISGRRLAVQRQQILERLETPSSGLHASRGSHASRWIPAAAVAALLAVALFLSRPSSVPQPAPAAASAVVNTETDSELFTDVYSMEQDVEPRAAAPIRALFQETSFQPAAPGEEHQNQ